MASPQAGEAESILPPPPSPLGSEGEGAVEDVQEAAANQLKRPLRNPTPYFLFAREERAKSANKISPKEVSERWRKLSAAEKKVYKEKFEAGRKRKRKLDQQYVQAGGKLRGYKVKAEFSTARVKKVMALDPSLRSAQREALSLMAKATEKFLALVIQRSERLRPDDRKTIQPEDFYEAIERYNDLRFLHIPMTRAERAANPIKDQKEDSEMEVEENNIESAAETFGAAAKGDTNDTIEIKSSPETMVNVTSQVNNITEAKSERKSAVTSEVKGKLEQNLGTVPVNGHPVMAEKSEPKLEQKILEQPRSSTENIVMARAEVIPTRPQEMKFVQQLQMAAPVQQLQMAAPAQQVQMATPAQRLQMAAPAHQLQMAAPSQQLQMGVPAQQVQMVAPLQQHQAIAVAQHRQVTAVSQPQMASSQQKLTSSPQQQMTVIPQQMNATELRPMNVVQQQAIIQENKVSQNTEGKTEKSSEIKLGAHSTNTL